MGTEPAARPAERRRTEIAKRERQLSTLADGQYGVLSRDQLLGAGLSIRTVRRRVAAGRLRCLHRGVYAMGYARIGRHGELLAAVFACGDGALLSHRSAASLWGLMYADRPVEVTAPRGRGRVGIRVHEGAIDDADRTIVGAIPVTALARTLFDLAEVVDLDRLERAWEEADRLRLLKLDEVERVCARGHGRRALKPIRSLLLQARRPDVVKSPLEDRFARFCREQELPIPQFNVLLLGHEVDALWPKARLAVELDGFEFHHHRSAFERDRVRDAARQVAGYRVLRLTHHRLESEPKQIATEIRHLLGTLDTHA